MKTEFEKIAELIEGNEFRFAVNIAPGFESFKGLIEQHQSFRMLAEFIHSKDGATLVEKRINEVMNLKFDRRFEHPYDAAVAAYLLVLKHTESEKINQLAYTIAENPQFWWAKYVGQEIIDERIIQEILETLHYGRSDTITDSLDYEVAKSYTGSNIANKNRNTPIEVDPDTPYIKIFKEAS